MPACGVPCRLQGAAQHLQEDERGVRAKLLNVQWRTAACGEMDNAGIVQGRSTSGDAFKRDSCSSWKRASSSAATRLAAAFSSSRCPSADNTSSLRTVICTFSKGKFTWAHVAISQARDTGKCQRQGTWALQLKHLMGYRLCHQGIWR